MDGKPLVLSKTSNAILLLVLGNISAWLYTRGITVSAETLLLLTGNIAAGVLGWYGRMSATQPITSILPTGDKKET